MTENLVTTSKFFSPVRVPRFIVENSFSQKSRDISRWADRIARCAKEIGSDVIVFHPDINSNKILVCGDEQNVFVAAALIRKAVIEICDETFDSQETLEFIQAVIEDLKAEAAKKEVPLPSCRVDFQTSLDSLDRRQTKSFERMQTLFNRIGVNISRLENRPKSIELSCADKATLKTARLTAEWAARTIGEEHEITQNQLSQTFGVKSVQALGLKRGAQMAQLAMA